MTARIALALLVLLSGCAAGPLGETTDRGTPDPSEFPPGASPSGLNASAVADAHESVLSNRSVTVRLAGWLRKGDGPRRNVTILANVGVDRERVYTWMDAADGEHLEAYRANGTEYRMLGTTYAGTTGRNYVVTGALGEPMLGPLDSYAASNFVAKAVQSANYSFAGTETLNGTTVFVYTADREHFSGTVDGNVTAFDAIVKLDERGVVRSYRLHAVSVADGVERETVERLAVTNVGETTVSKPDWVAEAKAAEERRRARMNESYTQTLRSHELGAAVELTGKRSEFHGGELGNFAEDYALLDEDSLTGVRVTPFVEVHTYSPVERAKITLSYDESDVPNGNESALVMYRFHEEKQTFFPTNSTVDPGANAVTLVTDDPLREDEHAEDLRTGVYVVFHQGEWRALWEEGAD